MDDKTQVNRLKVVVHGTEYILRGEDPLDHMKEVADKVNRMMNEVSSHAPLMDERKVAVLTALNIADELCKLRREYDELLQLLDDQTCVDNGRNG